jgi:hypothetical protein
MSETYPDVIEQIKNDSALVDQQFVRTSAEAYNQYLLPLPVPAHHPRAAAISETRFIVGGLETDTLPSDSYFLVDASLKDTPFAGSLGQRAHFVEATEGTLKELSWLDGYMAENVPETDVPVVGIGGGVLLNAAAYIAEKRAADFISVPTTILAAADSAIGGLVRINKVDGEQFQKSYYKSVYEPSSIVLDPQFLATLPKEQVRFGLSEVVKHGVYQSPALLEYLASDDFDPLGNQATLLKVVCWTAALKNVAIVHDPDSLSAGGDILRGGHKVALAIEEASHFKVSHGEAVAVGVYQDVLQDPVKLQLLDKIYAKLDLPRTQADLLALGTL